MTVLNRIYLVIGLIFLTVVLRAGDTGDASQDGAVKLSDLQVPRYLDTIDAMRWDAAMNLKMEGESDIESGNWLRSRRESALGIKVDLGRAREQGVRQIREGQEKIRKAEETLAELRQLATENYRRMMTLEKKVYSVEILRRTWADFIDTAVPRLFDKLWSAGYSRMYFAGAFQLEVPSGYDAVPGLDDELRTAFLAVDDRYSLIVTDSFRPVLKDNGEYLALCLPEDLPATTSLKAALILVQLVPLDSDGSWIVSLRGIDMETGKIVANEMALVPEYGNSSPVPEGQSSTAAKVVVEVNDEIEFLKRVERSKQDYLFSTLHRDRVNVERYARDLLLFKALVFNCLDSVSSDSDFLLDIRAKGENYPSPSRRLLPGVNAVWLINPQSGGDSDLHARNLAAGTELKVGSFRFEVIYPGRNAGE